MRRSAASLVSAPPGVDLRGAPFAPASHVDQAALLDLVTTTSLTGLAATILHGLDIPYPAPAHSSLLGTKAAALLPANADKVPRRARRATRSAYRSTSWSSGRQHLSAINV